MQQAAQTDITARLRLAVDGATAGPATRAGRRDGGRRTPALGKKGKFASTASSTHKSEDELRAARSRNTRLYALQRTAASLLPDEAVCSCGRRRRVGVDAVEVRSGSNGAYFAGVQHCGSVWHCPVCQARIGEVRRADCISALSTWRAAGHAVSLMTLTVPHQVYMPLSWVHGRIKLASRRFNSGRNALSRLLARYGYRGQIRAAETTYGQHGWHPHLHVLLFTDQVLLAEAEAVLSEWWERCCIEVGLERPGRGVGLTLQDGSAAASYVNKSCTWGMAEELTRAQSKRGRAGGMTPADLLQSAALGNAHHAALWREYALEFKGSKQLFWSRGLRDLLGLVEEVSDEEAADLDPAADLVVAVIEADQWGRVCHYEQRAAVLYAAETGGRDAIYALLHELWERSLADLRTRIVRAA